MRSPWSKIILAQILSGKGRKQVLRGIREEIGDRQPSFLGKQEDISLNSCEMEHWSSLEEQGYWYLSIFDSEYPELLRQIPDPPAILFGKGKMEALQGYCFTIVGTRKPTPYGMRMAHSFAEELSYRGANIVSGLAYGIDAQAHRGCCHAKGTTVAVMASGIDKIYPASHGPLADEICRSGCLITEVLPGLSPKPYFFPERNRILSGLSWGTLVVEADIQSGTMHTVRFAHEQGREVYVVPGRIEDPQARGTDSLIQQGAQVALCAEDISTTLYGWPDYTKDNISGKKRVQLLTNDEQDVYDSLSIRNMTMEMLLESLRWETGRLVSAITLLEMKGMIEETSGGFYSSTFPVT